MPRKHLNKEHEDQVYGGKSLTSKLGVSVENSRVFVIQNHPNGNEEVAKDTGIYTTNYRTL